MFERHDGVTLWDGSNNNIDRIRTGMVRKLEDSRFTCPELVRHMMRMVMGNWYKW